MSRISADVWTRLAGQQPQGETLWARRAAPDVTERIVAALDTDGLRHLVVSLLTDDADLQDAQSRGISVTTRELSMPGHAAGRYLDIVCQDGSGHEAFDMLGGELAERLAAGRESAPEVVARVLSKWRRFWGQPPKQLLSRQQQIGLVAELWFLGSWLIPKSGSANAVSSWRGPLRSRHDFEWAGRSVEVKATTSSRGHIYHINGLDQLAPPDNGDLLFFSLRLHEEGGGTHTLPSVVASCREQLANDAQALGLFENALSQIGYSPAHEEEYNKVKYRVVEEGLFNVIQDFPRLLLTTFSTGLPAGVERVEYEVNLAGFAHLCIARKPSEIDSF
jgi:hypothetical protein